MPYLIDTDWVIDYLADAADALQLLERLAEDGIAISIITYMEIYQGVDRSPNPAEAEAILQSFLEAVPILPFSLSVARRCAHLREELRSRRRRVNQRALDLIIAATALEHSLTLVTRNVEDYEDIPGVELYSAS
ncbi:MAG: type II toxin-antitoxin system VapC family toxin [Chloroflexi bacterium]|nr:type II toxin-antitoxin system VapC family toxin [Chloroflexota bacterium]